MMGRNWKGSLLVWLSSRCPFVVENADNEQRQAEIKPRTKTSSIIRKLGQERGGECQQLGKGEALAELQD